MITCAECIEQLRPDDPHIRSGRYGKCGCDYCQKLSYYRDLEMEKAEPEVIFRARPVDAEIDRLKAEVNYLFNKYAELKAQKRKQSSPF